MKRLSRGLRALADCAPIENTKAPDHRMRTAVSRAKRTEDFVAQQSFDRAIAKLVQATPVSPETRHWFANEKMAEGTKRSWKKTAFHPAILATGIALGVIAVVAWMKFDEQMHAFPGTATAKKLLNVAAMTRPSDFEPVQAEAGTLNDFPRSARLGSANSTTTTRDKSGKSASPKNECNCSCFRRPGTRKRGSRKNLRAGVTSNRRDGLARCRCTTAFFSWLRCAVRRRISLPIWRSSSCASIQFAPVRRKAVEAAVSAA